VDANQQAKRERGIAVIFVALFLLVSLWFVSMAIDVGKVMAARTELQAAADAAALAGASAIDPVTGVIDQPVAKARAAAAALENKAYQSVETPIVIDPEVDVEFPQPDRVNVPAKEVANWPLRPPYRTNPNSPGAGVV